MDRHFLRVLGRTSILLLQGIDDWNFGKEGYDIGMYGIGQWVGVRGS